MREKKFYHYLAILKKKKNLCKLKTKCKNKYLEETIFLRRVKDFY